LAIQGTKSFSGAINLSSGSISADIIANAGLVSSLGTGLSNPTIFFNGGTLDYNGSAGASTDRPMVLNSASATQGFRTTVANALTLMGPITGTGNLVKFGVSGELIIFGAKSYSGSVFINAGTVSVDSVADS